jgi:exopolysaccharide production protein ExoZ
MTLTQRRPSFDSIQYLRGLAALMIVAYHVRPRLERMGWDGYWPEWLGCGVDIFFVISGFIMWVTTYERSMTPIDFMLRRFLRIAPLYYAVTALTILLMVVAPKLAVSGYLDLTHIIASFAFFPTIHPVLNTFSPVLPQGWTLNYEMEFYALFALALLLPETLRRWAIPLVLTAIVLVGVDASDRSVAGFYSSSIILEFGFGVLLGVSVTRGLQIPERLAAVLFFAGVLAIPATWPIVEGGLQRVWASGLASLSIVAGAVFFELRKPFRLPRIFKLLGDASYSIYLTHGLCLTAVGAVWAKTRFSATLVGHSLFIPVAIACAVAGGIVVYLCVEDRMHQYSKALLGKRRAISAGVVTSIEKAPPEGEGAFQK